MNERVKYPLTPEAKEAACRLVQAWDAGKISQSLSLVEFTAGADTERILHVTMGNHSNDFKLPSLGVLRELDEYKLIAVENVISDRNRVVPIEITLLQELRNAVEHDFDVSDYFLTVTAVGTIVHGNIEMHGNSNFLSNVYGANIQNSGTFIAQELESILGDEVLKDADLKQAIDALRGSDGEPKESRLEKMKNVLDELGRCMQHTANAVQIASALGFVAHVIKALGG